MEKNRKFLLFTLIISRTAVIAEAKTLKNAYLHQALLQDLQGRVYREQGILHAVVHLQELLPVARDPVPAAGVCNVNNSGAGEFVPLSPAAAPAVIP